MLYKPMVNILVANGNRVIKENRALNSGHLYTL